MASSPLPSSASQTVTLVRMHKAATRSLHRTPGGHFKPGHKIRRARIPKQEAPKLLEAQFAADIIRGVVEVSRVAIRSLLDALPDLLAANEPRKDSADEDARPPEDASSLRFVAGLPIVVENPRGSTREWTDSDGTTGVTVMKHDYGRIAGTLGADGEDVDVYLGRVGDPRDVHIVHQMSKASGFTEYDEDKVMLGFQSAQHAYDAYMEQYNDARFLGGMSSMSIDEFRGALRDARGDAVDVGGEQIVERRDAGEPIAARRLLDRARGELEKRALGTTRLDALANQYGAAVSAHQRAQLARQVRAALGIDLVASDRLVGPLIERFAHASVTRIRSLGTHSLDDVERIVSHAFVNGQRAETVAKEIAERYEISERQARFIARDQIGTLNGQVNAARQQAIGISRFTWRTVEDERVREEHEILDGEVYDYGEPPEEGLPGEPYNCRCSAEPVFSDILEAADDE